jgi:FkbM family methyltransferase
VERCSERAVRVRDRRERSNVTDDFAFDQPHYTALNEAREATLRPLLTSLRNSTDLRTVIDVGSGLGYFSGVVKSLGFDVIALEGRPENVEEAKRRYPGIEFRVADAEDPGIRSQGEFDLGLCLGLLYHLENPFIAIRNLFAMTRKVAIVEGMVFPDERPVLAIMDEGLTEDQGLRYVALYPTENALIKLLYRAGFLYVYRLTTKPPHPDFNSSSTRNAARAFLVASRVPLSSDLIQLVSEPVTDTDPWAIRRTSARVARFLRKPWKAKAAAVAYHWVQRFPAVPVPVRLPFGAWWLARNDFVGAALFNGGFENIECSFVESFLRPGMSVLDIGAHHGFYTLLASTKVGAHGKVLAVEASPREREKLGTHLRLNRCKNVQIESRALGEADGEAQLYLVEPGESGCNSLRKPEAPGPSEAVPIQIRRLDDVLRDHKIEKVDFVKLDVEGAELSVLKGAPQLLSGRQRPVILAEVQDVRTAPWQYAAREIIQYLCAAGYDWFRPLQGGKLERIDTERKKYDGNFVAVPNERLESLGL